VDYLTSSVVGVAPASRRLYRAHLACQFWRGEHAGKMPALPAVPTTDDQLRMLESGRNFF